METQTMIAVLQADVVSSSASVIRAKRINNGRFDGDDDVPVHTYKCLKDIMFPGGATDSDFTSRIIFRYRDDKSNNDRGIDLMSASEEADKSDDREVHTDTLGDECAYVKVLCHLQAPVEDADKFTVQNMDLRVRLLLDANLRATYNPPARLDPSGIDNTIYPVTLGADGQISGGIECIWLKNVEAKNAAEHSSLYRVVYETVFA